VTWYSVITNPLLLLLLSLPLLPSVQSAIKTINQNVSVFTVGEMLMGDPFRWATDYIAHWVKDGAIGSAFNYPMVSTMRRTLRVSVGSPSPAFLAAQRHRACLLLVGYILLSSG
jgi:hypothetical protein